MSEVSGELTEDALLCGRVKLIQPAHGFRSSLDPLLLAGFVAPPFGHVLDIGCGTGAVAFVLLSRDAAATAVGVEIQPRLAACAALGAEKNGFGGRFALVDRDVRRVSLPAAAFDLVVSNPPFRPLGQGVLPPDPERAAAHHEVSLTLPEWLAVAARALAPEGRLAVIFPAERTGDLLAALPAVRLAATRLRPVLPAAGQNARRVLCEARRAPGRPLVLEPPLVLHDEGGYTAEVRRLLGETVD